MVLQLEVDRPLIRVEHRSCTIETDRPAINVELIVCVNDHDARKELVLRRADHHRAVLALAVVNDEVVHAVLAGGQPIVLGLDNLQRER